MNPQEEFYKSPYYKWIIPIIQLLLFALSVIAAVKLGMDRLDTASIINISFDWIAMIILIILFRNCCNGRFQSNTREFLYLILTLYLCVFFEVGSWSFDSFADLRVMNYVCNIGANCTILIASYLYYLFIRKSKIIDDTIFPNMKPVLWVTMVIGILAELINIFGGYFYVIDESGIYIRSPYGSYLGFIPFLVILIGSSIFIIRQKINVNVKLMYLSYCIVPFVCGLWYTLTGYPPTFFAAGAIALLLIHSDIYVVQSRESELLELKNAKTEAEYALARNMLILSQIKPHFLYNSLGSIEVLCSLDPDKAREAIHRFTLYLRSNMSAGSSETILFSQELKHIRNYVWLEKMRFDDDLEFIEEIETENFRVPQLSIQPLVENAIKHGMMGNEEGILHVTLKVTESDSEYTVIVSDDGCGFDPSQLPENDNRHIGLNTAAYNLKLIMNGTLDIESQIGKGTTVTIRIPKAQGGERHDNTCRR